MPDLIPEPLRDPRVEEAAAMIHRALLECNARDYSAEVIRNLLELYSPGNLRALLGTRELFVLLEDGEVAGTAGLDRDSVCAVFVDPRRQGRGLGTILVRRIEELARSRGVVELLVPSSITARPFYSRLGYTETGIRDDARYGRVILMRKRLAS